MKNYLKLILLFTVSGILLLTVISYLLDPYGIYAKSTDAFPRKVSAADKGRTVKPYQALHAKPFTVIVGNSRVEIGMPTEHAFYQGKPVYNMGLPGAGINMQFAYAMHAINSNDTVKQVVIALDFLDFTSRKDKILSSSDSSNWEWRLKGLKSEKFNDKRSYIAERTSLLFSLSALTDSVKTVLFQERNVNALNHYGFNDGRVYYFHVENEGFGALYQQKEQELDLRLSSQQLVFSEQSYHLQELDSFITELKKRDITIYLMINPYQQPYLDQLTKHKLDEHLAKWKIEMTSLASKHQLVLFDFAIPSYLVTDVVDPKSKLASDSNYFWEPSHYRHMFGELILSTLQSRNCSNLCKKPIPTTQ